MKWRRIISAASAIYSCAAWRCFLIGDGDSLYCFGVKVAAIHAALSPASIKPQLPTLHQNIWRWPSLLVLYPCGIVQADDRESPRFMHARRAIERWAAQEVASMMSKFVDGVATSSNDICAATASWATASLAGHDDEVDSHLFSPRRSRLIDGEKANFAFA